MKILLISEFFPTSERQDFFGGVEARTFFVGRYLAKKHRVVILTSRLKRTKKREIMNGMEIIRCGPERDYSQTAVKARVAFMMAAFKTGVGLDVDVVEGVGFFSLLPAYVIARKLRVPAIAWYPDTIGGSFGISFGPFWQFLLALWEKICLNLSWQKIITISQVVKQKLVEIGKDAKEIKVIYCGVDNKLLKTIKAKKEKEPTICYVGRLVKYKRVNDLIKAIGEIKKTIPNIQAKIIGQGFDEMCLRRMVKERSLEQNISFFGFIDNYKKLLIQIKSAHIFCLPSTVEGFAIVLLEATALGVPYVASDMPVLREVSRDGQGGLLFQTKDVNDLVKKIILLFKDENLRQKKSKEAIKLASHYEWKKIAEETERVYKEVISNV